MNTDHEPASQPDPAVSPTSHRRDRAALLVPALARFLPGSAAALLAAISAAFFLVAVGISVLIWHVRTGEGPSLAVPAHTAPARITNATPAESAATQPLAPLVSSGNPAPTHTPATARVVAPAPPAVQAELPVTGGQASLVAAAGLMLTLLGGGLVRLARHRFKPGGAHRAPVWIGPYAPARHR